MNIRYFVVFNAAGARQQTIVADGMPLSVADVIAQYPTAVEVSADDQLKLMSGWTMSPLGQLAAPVVTLADAKAARIAEVQRLARVKFAETDHDLIEYYDVNDLSDAELGALKVKRQAVRNTRDALVAAIESQVTVAKVNAIVIDFGK